MIMAHLAPSVHRLEDAFLLVDHWLLPPEPDAGGLLFHRIG